MTEANVAHGVVWRDGATYTILSESRPDMKTAGGMPAGRTHYSMV